MYEDSPGRVTRDGIRIHEDGDFAGMHKAGALAAQILDEVADQVFVGQSTDTIDAFIERRVTELGAKSATIGYKGYQHASCISVNHVVCHGIPGPYVLKDGDIINVDVTPRIPPKNGFHGDTSATFYIGEPSPVAKHLVEVTRECLEIGIAQVRPGARVGDIGAAIQRHAESKGCSVVREYTGHGIHRVFHDEPTIHHTGRPNTGPVLKRGMTFTIEPMINLGAADIVHLDDGWTVLTRTREKDLERHHDLRERNADDAATNINWLFNKQGGPEYKRVLDFWERLSDPEGRLRYTDAFESKRADLSKTARLCKEAIE